jgi:hypothetical protein
MGHFLDGLVEAVSEQSTWLLGIFVSDEILRFNCATLKAFRFTARFTIDQQSFIKIQGIAFMNKPFYPPHLA